MCDPRRHPARRLIGFYRERWEHEIAYLALRHTLADGQRAALDRPGRTATRNVGAAHRLPGDPPGHGHRGRIPTRHRSRPCQLHHRPRTAKDLLITAANATDDLDPVGHIGQAALADLLPPRRPRTSVRKVKSPLSRYNKKDPYRPEPSTPITSITATDPDLKHATQQAKSLTTALGR
ncbi:hypothetical protein [Candidatus Mycobacterium methanotrophicum]|uniref:hypothetical protein n=1 Tax=Candidatus Mycobacterium methanotrophicum TaxID=2943498 RepID=UPI001C58348F